MTVRHLLTHSSGLTAYLPFYRDLTGRPEFQHAICRLPLEYAPDSQSIYSDLGFILLAFILEDAAAAAESIAGGGRAHSIRRHRSPNSSTESRRSSPRIR